MRTLEQIKADSFESSARRAILDTILKFDPIKHVSTVEAFFTINKPKMNDREYENLSSMVKSKIQKQVEEKWIETGHWGAIHMATGSGKSKIAINIINRGFAKLNEDLRVLIVVPTQKLRDRGWKEEFEKWHSSIIYDCVRTICYDSLNTIKDSHYHLVIFDEGHNLTEDAADFLDPEWNNVIDKALLMTATAPTDGVKKRLLKNLNLLVPFYEIDLDTAVRLNIVADYQVTMVMMNMTVTEANEYEKFNRGRMKYNMFNMMNRMHFIYQLKSKEEVAKILLEKRIPPELRLLIFCGSKDQANKVNAEATYYSKPTKPKKLDPTKKHTPKKVEKYNKQLSEYEDDIKYYMGSTALEKFEMKDINRLACVNSLNEGQNIDDLDSGFIIQINSKEIHLIQRMGRIIRMRANHIGQIIILVVRGTVDEVWAKKATQSINPDKIRIVDLQDLRTNKAKLFT